MPHRILNEIVRARKSGDLATAGALLSDLLARKRCDDPGVLHQLGLLHAAQGNWEEALAAHRRCLELRPGDLTFARRVADALLATGRYAEARTVSARIVRNEKGFNERDHLRLSQACALLGDHHAARDTLVRAMVRWRRNRESPPPSGALLIVAAMPKTASTSLAHALARALNWPSGDLLCHSGPHLFSHTVLIGRNLAQLKGIGYVGHTHMLPRQANLRLLAAHPHVRLVVHFRDPREALVSALDMFHRTRAGQFLLREPELADMPLERQVDWMLKHYLPLQTHWMRGWKRALDEGLAHIATVTTFNRLVREGQDALARAACERLGLRVVNDAATRPRRHGVRKLGGWREIFTLEQKRRAQRLLLDAEVLSLLE